MIWVMAILNVLIMTAIPGLIIAGLWRTFEKAGKPGWAALVPFYNMWVAVEIVKKPVWWFIMFFIPIAGFVFWILVCLEMAKCFGKSAGYGVGLALLGFVFFPMLGLGDAQYEAPAGAAPRPRQRADEYEEEEEEEDAPRPRRRAAR